MFNLDMSDLEMLNLEMFDPEVFDLEMLNLEMFDLEMFQHLNKGLLRWYHFLGGESERRAGEKVHIY